MTRTHPAPGPSPAAERHGVVLVCVLVCACIATTLAITATAAALHQRQRVRSERQLRQVELLLDAGMQRAVRQLSSTSSYSGETWRLESGTMPGFPSARVHIDVTRQSAVACTVAVVATLPADAQTPVQRTHRFRYVPTKPAETP